jgi:hypothetical protein
MPIKQVVRYKGGPRDEMLRLAAVGKECNERHGAVSFVFTQIYTGEHSGQWQAEMVFADWASFGEVQRGLASDAVFQAAVAEVAKLAVFQERMMFTVFDI